MEYRENGRFQEKLFYSLRNDPTANSEFIHGAGARRWRESTVGNDRPGNNKQDKNTSANGKNGNGGEEKTRSRNGPYGVLSKVISNTMYTTYERKLLQDIKRFPVPYHIAIIMDGNRRFAEKLGLSRVEGHERGKDKVDDVLDWAREMGVKVVTVYALSSENFNRSSQEIEELMDLFQRAFREAGDDKKVHKFKIQIRAIGNLKNLPERVRESIKYAEDRTKDYSNYYYNVAVSYGGRQEIIQAIRRIATHVRDGEKEIEDIDEEMVSSYLYTADLPDPDLILRTSGEERISNFLLWQLAYSELYFTDVYWPEFRKIDFLSAIRDYQKRKRKYGK